MFMKFVNNADKVVYKNCLLLGKIRKKLLNYIRKIGKCNKFIDDKFAKFVTNC